jgi:hypothetical protein
MTAANSFAATEQTCASQREFLPATRACRTTPKAGGRALEGTHTKQLVELCAAVGREMLAPVAEPNCSARLQEEMVGTRRLELLTSTVSR